MKPSAPTNCSRREFLRGCARNSVLLMAALTGVLLVREKRVAIKSCSNEGICSNCRVYSDCGLPAALSRKQTLRQRLTSTTK